MASHQSESHGSLAATPHRVRTAGQKPWEMGGSVLESKSGEHSDEGEAVDRLSGGLPALGFYVLGLYVRF